MAQFNPKRFRSFYRGRVKMYYSYDDELYAGTFPEIWAKNHSLCTGPKECMCCRNVGWNGVFVGYCEKCAIHVYNGTRGKGFISPGKESEHPLNLAYDSAFDTYLRDVNLHDVGDPDIYDSLANIINQYAADFIYRNPRDVLAAFERMTDELSDNDDGYGEDYGEGNIEYFIDSYGIGHPITDIVPPFKESPFITMDETIPIQIPNDDWLNDPDVDFSDYGVDAETIEANRTIIPPKCEDGQAPHRGNWPLYRKALEKK